MPCVVEHMLVMACGGGESHITTGINNELLMMGEGSVCASVVESAG